LQIVKRSKPLRRGGLFLGLLIDALIQQAITLRSSASR